MSRPGLSIGENPLGGIPPCRGCGGEGMVRVYPAEELEPYGCNDAAALDPFGVVA